MLLKTLVSVCDHILKLIPSLADMKCLLPYCLLGMVLICFIAGCKKPQPLHYLDFQNFSVSDITKGQSDISAELKFYNPNSYRLRLKYAEMNFYLNDQYFGRSVLDTLMVIPKADTFLIPVVIKGVQLKKVIANGLGALITNEFAVRLDGQAKIGKAGIYFKFPLHYEGKQKLNLFR